MDKRCKANEDKQAIMSAFLSVRVQPRKGDVKFLMKEFEASHICKAIIWLSQFGVEDTFVRLLIATLRSGEVM